MIITENQLDEWVRGHAIKAQGVIVELVWRLAQKSADSVLPFAESTELSDYVETFND